MNTGKTKPLLVETEKRNACVAHVPVGTLTIRNTHTPTLNRREKLSMLDVTSKIMSASVKRKFFINGFLKIKFLEKLLEAFLYRNIQICNF